MLSFYRFSLLFLVVISCLISAPTSAQNSNKVTVVGGDMKGKEIVFVAESHAITEKKDFYNALIPYLANDYGICNLVLETSHSSAYLLNSFLYNNDSTIFIYNTDSTSVKSLLQLKALFLQLPKDKRIRIYGMDFERMEFVVVAKKIFEQNGFLKSDLYQYINSLPDSFHYKVRMTPAQSKLRIDVYAKAREFFNKEKQILKDSIKIDYETLERIFENPTLESKFSRRDKGMYQNIDEQLKGKPFMCIVGRYHTEYHRHQVYPSLIKLIVKGNPINRKKLMIIDEVSNIKYLTTPLWSVEGAEKVYTSGKAGPEYFTTNDSAMLRAYKHYTSGDKYVLVHKNLFSDIVHKDNHGLDSYFIFFGERSGN